MPWVGSSDFRKTDWWSRVRQNRGRTAGEPWENRGRGARTVGEPWEGPKNRGRTVGTLQRTVGEPWELYKEPWENRGDFTKNRGRTVGTLQRTVGEPWENRGDSGSKKQ